MEQKLLRKADNAAAGSIVVRTLSELKSVISHEYTGKIIIDGYIDCGKEKIVLKPNQKLCGVASVEGIKDNVRGKKSGLLFTQSGSEGGLLLENDCHLENLTLKTAVSNVEKEDNAALIVCGCAKQVFFKNLDIQVNSRHAGCNRVFAAVRFTHTHTVCRWSGENFIGDEAYGFGIVALCGCRHSTYNADVQLDGSLNIRLYGLYGKALYQVRLTAEHDAFLNLTLKGRFSSVFDEVEAQLGGQSRIDGIVGGCGFENSHLILSGNATICIKGRRNCISLMRYSDAEMLGQAKLQVKAIGFTDRALCSSRLSLKVGATLNVRIYGLDSNWADAMSCLKMEGNAQADIKVSGFLSLMTVVHHIDTGEKACFSARQMTIAEAWCGYLANIVS